MGTPLGHTVNSDSASPEYTTSCWPSSMGERSTLIHSLWTTEPMQTGDREGLVEGRRVEGRE